MEQRIAQSPWLVSADYFRQRQAQAVDTPPATRAQSELGAKALEERAARIEGGGAAAAVVPGYVVRVDGRRIYTDLGARQPGMATGAALSILAERELVHPVSGRSLGWVLEEIGAATVVEVTERFSVAEVTDLRSGQTVKPKDRVAVRRP